VRIFKNKPFARFAKKARIADLLGYDERALAAGILLEVMRQ
jgi:hypothetical protein